MTLGLTHVHNSPTRPARASFAMNAESPATALRPRIRRLISLDEGDDASASTNDLTRHSLHLDSPAATSSASQPPASRNDPANISSSRAPSRTRNLLALSPQGAQSPSIFSSGLWETSWSSFQSIASNLISGDKTRGRVGSQSPRPNRRPLEATQNRKSSGPAQWGPSGSGGQHLGYGSREDRLAQVQARKRETLLAADSYLVPDATGRYKRRDSEDRSASSAKRAESEDRDTLVYLHKVKPSDTLAGVMIKYNCQPNAFRKANRLWPNDSIQVRTTVVLPVEACGVKGRKVPDPRSSSGLLDDGMMEESMVTPTNAHHPWPNLAEYPDVQRTPFSSIRTSPSVSVSKSEDQAWKHDSWVMIDGFTEAVEIGRLSRRTLGFFPRNRRKSSSFSDLDTPVASVEESRESHANERHQRKKSRSSSGSHFAHQLEGPGGVGTLGRDVRNPGPAQDRLNKIFAPHLPNVAPRASFESVASTSSTGVENVGGTIEGWVRKLAGKAAARVQSPAPGGRSGIGDLIELVDSMEVSDGVKHGIENGSTRTAGKSHPTEAWRDEQERSLREHFPPRGRIFGESTRRKGPIG